MPNDRRRVRQSFERHAAEYDANACVQKRVVRRLSALLAEVPLARRVLDVGAGTGLLLNEVGRLFPQAGLFAVDLAFDMAVTAQAKLPSLHVAGADAEQLPLRDAVFDLVVSTSTFQWLDRLEIAFAEVFRVLKPGGRFIFALFGERTLYELRDSYRAACRKAGREGEERTRRFFHVDEVAAALAATGFTAGSAFSEPEEEFHRDVPSLLRSVRRIGAGNPAPPTTRGLSERRVMMEMMDIYRTSHLSDGLIPATYDVIYGAGRKPSADEQRPQHF